MLPAAILGVDDLLHRVGQLAELDRFGLMARPPGGEDFGDTLPAWIAGLDRLNPFDRIAAAERDKRVASPFRPLLKTPNRLAAGQLRCIVPAPAPDCEHRCQELGAVCCDVLKEA